MSLYAPLDGHCTRCGQPAYITEPEPLCERHYELALLISRVERRRLPVTAANVITQMKEAVYAVWHIAESEVAGMLREWGYDAA